MKREEKERLTGMMQELLRAHKKGGFKKAWSAMQKELSAMPVEPEEPRCFGTVTKEELALFDHGRKFHCRNEAGETRMFAVDDEDTVLVYSEKKQHVEQTLSYDEFLTSYFIVGDTDTTPGWRARIRKAIGHLELSGLWPEVREVLEKILESGMTWEDRQFLSSLNYDGKACTPADPERIKEYKDAYPFVFDGNIVNPEYVSEMTKCRIKSICSGGWAGLSGGLRKILEGEEDYRTSQSVYEMCGIIFEYKAQEKKAFYTEEHRRSGDTHRCIALNDHVALFCEPTRTRILA